MKFYIFCGFGVCAFYLVSVTHFHRKHNTGVIRVRWHGFRAVVRLWKKRFKK